MDIGKVFIKFPWVNASDSALIRQTAVSSAYTPSTGSAQDVRYTEDWKAILRLQTGA